MDVQRVTATFDEETLTAIRQVAGPRGVSKFLQEAARHRLSQLRLLGLLDELDAKHGPVSDAVRRGVAKDARRIFKR